MTLGIFFVEVKLKKTTTKKTELADGIALVKIFYDVPFFLHYDNENIISFRVFHSFLIIFYLLLKHFLLIFAGTKISVHLCKVGIQNKTEVMLVYDNATSVKKYYVSTMLVLLYLSVSRRQTVYSENKCVIL